MTKQYNVFNNRFDTFDDVMEWAWNEHKILLDNCAPCTEEEFHEACRELEQMLSDNAQCDFGLTMNYL